MERAMRSQLTAAVVLTVAAFALAGCSNSTPTTGVPRHTATYSAAPASKVHQFQPTAVVAACEADLVAAAKVPMSESNDKQLEQSAQDYTTVDEWGAAVQRHPKALNMADHVPDSYLTTDLEVLCSRP
jgi:hypothetical protein